MSLFFAVGALILIKLGPLPLSPLSILSLTNNYSGQELAHLSMSSAVPFFFSLLTGLSQGQIAEKPVAFICEIGYGTIDFFHERR